MTQKDKIIVELYESPEIEKLIDKISQNAKRVGSNISHVYYEDAKHELFVILCAMPEEKLVMLKTNGGLNWYIIKILTNTFKSRSSQYFRKYNLYYEIMDLFILSDDIQNLDIEQKGYELKEYHDRLDLLDEGIESLDEFQKIVLKKYLECGTITKTSKLLKVDKPYISRYLKASREFLKNFITKKNEERGIL